MTHAPSGLVVQTKLVLEFLAADTATRRAKHIDGVKPRNQRRPRVMEDSVRRGPDLVEAVRGGIDATLAQLVELAFNAASRAVHQHAAKANRNDVLKQACSSGKRAKNLATLNSGEAEGLLFVVPS